MGKKDLSHRFFWPLVGSLSSYAVPAHQYVATQKYTEAKTVEIHQCFKESRSNRVHLLACR